MENLPRGRRSRRSSSNLNLSNISPLTTHFSLTTVDSAFNDITNHATSSYIQGTSAPSTPSILSRASSTRRPRHPAAISVPPTPTGGHHRPSSPKLDKITKSKSAGYLVQERTSRTSYFDPKFRRNESTEWVHRAGIALTSGTRESKGQSWLVSRASSTSLLDHDASSDEENLGGPKGTDLVGVRSGSTIMRPKSKPKLRLDPNVMSEQHPFAPEFIDEAFRGNSFDDQEGDRSFDYEDDEEDLHWSKRPRNGLGAWVDRLVGWSLFSVDEDYDASDDEEVLVTEKRNSRSQPVQQNAVPESERAEVIQLPQETGWQDAAWILSVATKVIF